MRYHTNRPDIYSNMYGETYYCNHVVYSECTLFKIHAKGLAVIQQRYSSESKHTWWGCIDDYLRDKIYLHPYFKEVFEERARLDENGIYPTITIRQLMWSLRMKPLPKQSWETCFDRRDI